MIFKPAPPVVPFPYGRDWTCTCGYRENEFARPDSAACPHDGRTLTRIRTSFNLPENR